ncbi:MAG: helix-turn-helix domain-containing protein [Oscillospiraceae bacterium]|nr:helix-turn-helix domain-containing protein [Oscillospiraceae bacterium]
MNKRQLTDIGERLRKHRNELKLSREQFSELAGISASFYGQIEVGTSQMSIDTLVGIAKALHLPLEYVLFGTGYAPPDADPVISLIKNASARQIKLLEQVVKLFLMKVD